MKTTKNNSKGWHIKKATSYYQAWKITSIVAISILVAIIIFFIICLSLTAKKYSDLKLDKKSDEEVFKTLSNIWYSIIKYIPGKEEGTLCVGFTTNAIMQLAIACGAMALGIIACVLSHWSKSPKQVKSLTEDLYKISDNNKIDLDAQ